MEAADLAARLTSGSEMQIGWQELLNKLQAFYLFEHVDSILAVPPDSACLTSLIDKASALGSYSSVWAIEGLAHYYMNLHLRQQIVNGRLCHTGENTASGRMVPLHSGMALSLAESLLHRTGSSSTQVRRSVERFIDACRQNCAEGYLGAGYEGLGLVARNLYPHLVPLIDSYLSQSREDVLPFFWHGVGRAIYFSPLNSLPFGNAPCAGLETCMREPPHQRGKRNAVAGYVWALTLVNVRHPQVIASLVRRRGHNMIESEAFSYGVYSGLIAWLDSSPQDEFVRAFCGYQPVPSDSGSIEAWERYVKRPGEQAIKDFPDIKTAKRIGELFRY